MTKTKRCLECGETKPIEDYYGVGTGSTWARCRPCARALRRKPAAEFGHPCAECGKPVPPSKNPGQLRRFCSRPCANGFHARIAGRAARFAQYGITEADYLAMREAQGGRCAICGTDDAASKSGEWHIDHCHDTGKVRGLLCTRCNIGIGQMMDDPARLRAAADYLES